MMRLLSACLVVLIFANAKSDSEAEGGLRGSAIAGPDDGPQRVSQDGEKCDVNSLNKIVCENDKLTFCGPNNQIMSVPCAVNGRPGFCNCEKTACVSQKPVCQDEETDCLLPNTKLPNNLDCHSYTYCTKDKKKITLVCPGNLIFDPNVEKCMDRSKAQCRRIACPRPGNTLQLIPFPQAKNYYVLCYNGIGDVRKCPDKYHSVQNNVCRFDCQLRKDSGLFKDTNVESCERGVFYACMRAARNFITFQAKCPPKMTFDEKLGLCTEGNNCKESENSPGSESEESEKGKI